MEITGLPMNYRRYFKDMTMKPDHLFIAGNGDLFDTRREDWSNNPLRENYQYTFASIENTSRLLATLRNGAYAWPGGYPMYFITYDGGALSFASVKENLREIIGALRSGNRLCGWYIIGCEINYEDADLYCAHSNERIESAYAES